MIFDDYVGKEVVLTAEGGQNLGGGDNRAVFLGLERVDNISFVRLIHYYEQEMEVNGALVATMARDDVFIQLRKIKSLHFGLDENEATELLAIFSDDNAGLEFEEF